MQLFDTLRGAAAPLEIPQDRPLTLYVCGVTPYDTTHIGHAHTFLIFDVLQRYLRYQGAEVRYCQNVTDVDDPLFERAKRDGVAWDELARRETEQFRADCAAMNMLAPTYAPKASEEIAGMQAIIAKLVELGYGYAAGGSAYYRARMAPDYGAMPKLDYEALLAVANTRGNNPADPNKEDPLDFVLWQPSRPGEPSWPSPWGEGRPGWHIECTAMSTRYLGDQIDIHGGGSDLVFPHHPSEIAQTEPVTGKSPFVRFWVHGGMARLDGEKMSKSLGNMVFVRDALKEHTADALRWYLMSFHYRADFDYVREDVVATESKITQLKSALRAESGAGAPLDAASYRAAFLGAMDADLNTPAALHTLDALSGAVLAAAREGRDLAKAQATLRELAGAFGFLAAE
ncbi:cysteine--tRNA ligase [Chloroflexia bacterium SDU3-3]|nr:cysteine--tRNA ligase [Chloroflexia bacterium SDU3-3]